MTDQLEFINHCVEIVNGKNPREREANVNEILEFEAENPETQAEFVNRLTDELTAALQDPNRLHYPTRSNPLRQLGR